MSPALEKAVELLGLDPLPADIEQQLEALEAQAPRSERDHFGDVWEALHVAQSAVAE